MGQPNGAKRGSGWVAVFGRKGTPDVIAELAEGIPKQLNQAPALIPCARSSIQKRVV
jgi:hypothetical protein